MAPPEETPAPASGEAGVVAAPGPVLLGRTQVHSEDLATVTSAVGSGSCPVKADMLDRASSGGTLLRAASSRLERAASNLGLQRATTLPTEDKDLRHAATMPMIFDVEADRPWCGGLWKTQQMVGCVLGLTIAILLIAIRPMHVYPKANDMLGIAALCACFWVFEVIPVYMTALFPMVLMPFLGVTSSELVALGYWNWVSLLVVGTYLVAIALEEVRLPRRLALKLLLQVGVVNPASLLACFMGFCWILGMFANSVAVTLLMTPFAIGLMQAAEEQASLAQLADETGSSGGDSMQANEGTAAHKEASRRKMNEEGRAVLRLADCLLLGIAYSATAGGMATLTGAIANYFLAGGSIAVGEVHYGNWFLFAFPISLTTVLVAYVVLWARYLRNLRFQGLQREVLEAEYEELLCEVGPVSRDEVLVGLVQFAQIVLFIIRPFAISPRVTTQYGDNLVNDATIACMPALLLFFIPSVVHPGKAVLTWPAVHGKFDFGLLILIGGALAINQGFTESGLNEALGAEIAKMIPHVSPFGLNVVIIVVVAICSQILSSIGTAAAMQPVLVSAAQQAMVNPLSLMLPATIATSFAFMLPTATPANVVVLARSQEMPRSLRIRDFFLNGFPVTVFMAVLGALLVQGMGSTVYQSNSPYPLWACQADQAGCLWVPVPGVVQGWQVAQQACKVEVAESDGTQCQLWNGTMLDTLAFMPGSL